MPTAFPYRRISPPFLGNFSMIEYIAPKYDNNGDIDSRYVIFAGNDTSVSRTRLGVILFNSQLKNL
jgi:hypothetical protein